MITGLGGQDRSRKEVAELEARLRLVRSLERTGFGQSGGEIHDGANLRTVQSGVRTELSGLRPGK